MKRIFRGLLTLVILAAVFLATAYFVIAPNRTKVEAEQYAVLSAYVQPGLTGDSHDLGSPRGTLIILEQTTFSDQAIPKGKFRDYVSLFGAALVRRKSLSTLTLANFLISNLSDYKFEKKFAISANYILASKEQTQTWPSAEFGSMFPDNYGYLTFSRIGFNSKLTEAYFYTEHLCGLCGDGKFVRMQKIDGKWVVVEESGTWIS